MPIISNSFSLDDITEVIKSEPVIREKLNSAISKNKSENLTDIKRVLNQAGGSIEDASSVITEVMHNSEYDNTRLKAAEIVLDLHEVRNKDGLVNKQPIINFNIVSDEVKIANIFAPHTDRL